MDRKYAITLALACILVGAPLPAHEAGAGTAAQTSARR